MKAPFIKKNYKRTREKIEIKGVKRDRYLI